MRRTIKKQFWFSENEARELKRKADITCLSEAAVIRFLLQGYEPKEQPGIEFFQKMNELGEIAAYLRRIVARAEQLDERDLQMLREEANKWNLFQCQIESIVLSPIKSNLKWE